MYISPEILDDQKGRGRKEACHKPHYVLEGSWGGQTDFLVFISLTWHVWSHWKINDMLHLVMLLVSLYRIHYIVSLCLYDFGRSLVKGIEGCALKQRGSKHNCKIFLAIVLLSKGKLPSQIIDKRSHYWDGHWHSHYCLLALGKKPT